MKIAYVASFGNTYFNGVFRKIDSQLSVWRSLGMTVKTFFRAVKGVNIPGRNMIYHISVPPTCAYTGKLIADIRSFSPDIIYLRHEICGPQILRLLQAFPGKVALEINSDLDAELRLEAGSSWKRRVAFWVNRMTSRYMEKYIGACICVSSDFLQLFPTVPRSRKIVSPNCIDLDKYPLCKQSGPPGPPPALLFAGSPNQEWHGVDLLLPLARALPEYIFHIVGPEALPTAPANMIFHGYQPPEQLQSFYSRCHIGIGSLAFFRKKIYEASPLKVREYIAAGLPVILGYADSAFKEKQPPWALSLEPRERLFEDAMTVEKVRNFIKSYTSVVVPHEESADYIDAYHTETRKIQYLEELFCTKP